jgi:HAD superfamily hydrolase (TIGR01509 family)
MIQAIVFDFDGVLANSEQIHLRTAQEIVGALGVSLTNEEYYQRYLGFDDETMFRAIAAAHGWDLDARQLDALIAEKARLFDEFVRDTDVLYPAAAICVERLADRYPLGIASGALKHEIQGILRRGRIEHFFRFIVAGGDTPAGKPAPDPYRRAAELHARPPEACLAIEDSRWGIESAKAAGLKCVGITHTYPAGELAGADAVIGSLEEFDPGLIESL